ncbi:hypothetical protein [Mesorhizobium sp. WSM3860]|uniref:hypothetical protein n=1 Tax=Mesorhizobium sp. WSM3860 TaxID=2029403 RepID=UPI001FE0F91A|nr:hypothetical protein [Mesorhizobium sp. WSM3860]
MAVRLAFSKAARNDRRRCFGFREAFKQVDDSEAAHNLVDRMLEQGRGFLAPSVVLYEALSAALHVELPLTVVGQLFDQSRELGLAIEEPTMQDLATAEKIATSAAPGNGYPTLFDGIHHAMALERGGTFVTADQRHIAKGRAVWRRCAAGGLASRLRSHYSAAPRKALAPVSNCSLASRA